VGERGVGRPPQAADAEGGGLKDAGKPRRGSAVGCEAASGFGTVSKGAILIAIGAALLVVVEIEKQIRPRPGRCRRLTNMKER
jgi:hypothetical protein